MPSRTCGHGQRRSAGKSLITVITSSRSRATLPANTRPQCAAGREAARIQKPFDGQTLLEAVHAVLSTAPAAEPG